MKKQIFQYYLLTLALVFVATFAWEFWLEPLVGIIANTNYHPETFAVNLEYIITVTTFCAVALIIPALIALKIEIKRQETIESLRKLQQQTADLLDQRTVELTSARQHLHDKVSPVDTPDSSITKQVTLQTLIDSISDTILVIDANYHVRMSNRAAREHFLTDHDAEKTRTLTCHKMTHDEDKPCEGTEHQCPFKTVMESGESCTVVHRHKDRHGDLIPFEIKASPIFDDDGKIIGIIEIARNVSDRLAIEQKRRAADVRLLDLQKQQSIATLAGGLAHEFNNILTSILGNAELLHVRLDEKDVNKKQVEAIITGSEQLADLTKQLLAYAKGGKYLEQTIAINELISISLNLIDPQKITSIEVDLDLADDLWTVVGDPAQVGQLIMNILINGIEALEEKDGKLIIKTANITKNERWHCTSNNTHPPGDYVFCSVTNTGSTIPADLLGKIFDPFFSTKFTGRGLGLAAAKGIVENHNGCITVESPSNQVTFQFLLPRAISDYELMKSDRKSSENALNLKVLVVDDEPQVLSITKNLLEHQGCKVLSADKGLEALEVIERHKGDLDLVILDIQMPDMTGDKVYSRLKDIKPTLKVLISSGYEEYTALKDISLDPNDRFIKKPFRMSELMLKIKELSAHE